MTKLIVRTPNWIGDAILSLPALNYLYEKTRQSFDILSVDKTAEIFSSLPYINRVFVFSKRTRLNISEIKNVVKKLRKEKYDRGILLPNSFSSALIFRLSCIKDICGYGRDGRGFLLSKSCKPHPDYKAQHHVFYYLNLISQILDNGSLDYADITPERYPLAWKILEEETKKAREIFKQFGIKDDSRLIGISAGASYGPARKWSKRNFVELAKNLVNNYNCQIILLGGAQDKELSAYIKDNIRQNIFDFTGQTNLRIDAAVMKLCRVIVANDSGPMHLASAVNASLVAIFGSTDIKRTSPWSKNYRLIYKNISCSPCFDTHCRYKHYNCLKNISVEEVTREVGKRLV
jgi:heptosyltransferase-2